MSIRDDSPLGASAAKVTAVATGAVMSGVESIGVDWQHLIWIVTFIYGALQIVRSIPWLVDQCAAYWCGIRHGDWSRLWAIARRGEGCSDKSENK